MSRFKVRVTRLKEAASLLHKYGISGTQFQVKLERQQLSGGSYRTKANIVLGKNQYHGRNKGLLHKAVNMKYRFVGDTPSITKKIDSMQPQTFKGKAAKYAVKAAYTGTKKAAKIGISTALATETVTVKLTDKGVKAATNTVKQKLTPEEYDDIGKAITQAGRIGNDALKGTKSHFKQKKQNKLEKEKYKLQKQTLHNFKPSYKEKRTDLRQNKRDNKAKNNAKLALYQAKFNDGGIDKTTCKQLTKRQKQRYKVRKQTIKHEKKAIKSDYKFMKKNLHNQKKIKRYSSAGFLALKPVKYTSGRMAASAWQKSIHADENNDFLRLADNVEKYTVKPVKEAASKPARLQRKQNKRDNLQSKESKTQNKLQKESNKLEHKKEKPKKKKAKKKSQKKNAEKIKENVKKAAKAAVNAAVKAVSAFMKAFTVPFVIIILIIFLLLIMLSSCFAGGTWILGTYSARDDDLSKAERYYTQLASTMNRNIVNLQGSGWRSSLIALGADASELSDRPSELYFGRSTHFDYDTADYDYEAYKLWAFLCAYYYDFSVQTTEVKDENGHTVSKDIAFWEYGSDTEDLLDEIFAAEYEFEYYYNNKSHWEELTAYTYDGMFHHVSGSGISGDNGYVTFNVIPNELSKFSNGNTVYFNIDNGEILNFQNNYSATGWYFQDMRKSVTDSAGSVINSFYTYDPYMYQTSNSKGYGSFYNIDGIDIWFPKSYWSLKLPDGRDFQEVFCVEASPIDVAVWKYKDNPTGKAYINYLYNSGVDLYYDGWDYNLYADYCKNYGEQNDGYNGYGFSSFYQMYEWTEECQLFYNVKQLKTFDEVIENKLKNMSYGDERWQNYLLLIGEDGDESKGLYGNHQTFHWILEEDSIQDCIAAHKLYTGYGFDTPGWNQESALGSTFHNGIDILCADGTSVRCPLDGFEIKSYNENAHSVILRKNKVEYWYEDNASGKARDTEITILNIKLLDGYNVGDELADGEVFAVSTSDKKCPTTTQSSAPPYIHIAVNIDTNGFGWDYIDPILVFY